MNTFKKLAFVPQTVDSTEGYTRNVLEATMEKMGMIPNTFAGMANNPALFTASTAAYNAFRTHSNFTSVEQEVVLLTISHDNGCEYCMASHCTIADTISGVPREVTDAIRSGNIIPDAKLNALSVFTRALSAKRGFPTQEDVEAFLTAGYTTSHVMDILAAIGSKVMSNYFNHIFDVELDEAFEANKWENPAVNAGAFVMQDLQS